MTVSYGAGVLNAGDPGLVATLLLTDGNSGTSEAATDTLTGLPLSPPVALFTGAGTFLVDLGSALSLGAWSLTCRVAVSASPSLFGAVGGRVRADHSTDGLSWTLGSDQALSVATTTTLAGDFSGATGRYVRFVVLGDGGVFNAGSASGQVVATGYELSIDATDPALATPALTATPQLPLPSNIPTIHLEAI